MLKLRYMKRETESNLKHRICDYLALRKDCFFWIESNTGIYDPVTKCYRRKNSPYEINGKADILGIFRGRPLAIEVKVKPNKLSDNQKLFLEKFSNYGGIVIVAYSVNDVIQAIERQVEVR